jgi:hypothetical protein
VGFVVGKMKLRQLLLRVLRFSLVNDISPTLPTHISFTCHPHVVGLLSLSLSLSVCLKRLSQIPDWSAIHDAC